VHFAFSTQRVNDSILLLEVKATMAKNAQIFSVKKRNTDDPFVSSLQLDSSVNTFQNAKDTTTEIGNLQLVKEEGGTSSYRLFSDSVIFKYTLHVAKEKTKKSREVLTGLLNRELNFQVV